MIPKKIFQTYKVPFNELSDNAMQLIIGWKTNNPDYEYYYYSDEDVEKFILKYFDADWHKRFLSLEYPVMKADVFRMLVVYIYGGFYVDLDMVSLTPLNYINKETTKASFGVHNYALLTHPFFGFSEKHPMLKFLIDSLAKSIDNNKIESFIDPDHIVHQKHYLKDMHNRDILAVRYVMDVTGPCWWAESIADYLGLDTKNLFDLVDDGIPLNVKKKMQDEGIEVFNEELEPRMYDNLLGSQNNFYGEGYQSWYGRY
jgi:hypothetical protein